MKKKNQDPPQVCKLVGVYITVGQIIISYSLKPQKTSLVTSPTKPTTHLYWFKTRGSKILIRAGWYRPFIIFKKPPNPPPPLPLPVTHKPQNRHNDSKHSAQNSQPNLDTNFRFRPSLSFTDFEVAGFRPVGHRYHRSDRVVDQIAEPGRVVVERAPARAIGFTKALALVHGEPGSVAH